MISRGVSDRLQRGFKTFVDVSVGFKGFQGVSMRFRRFKKVVGLLMGLR